jgi:hypothetical protein
MYPTVEISSKSDLICRSSSKIKPRATGLFIVNQVKTPIKRLQRFKIRSIIHTCLPVIRLILSTPPFWANELILPTYTANEWRK